VYQVTATNGNESFKFGEYIFKYTKELKPIPVEVPCGVAKILLQMVSKSCRCHNEKPKYLFRKV
jgi:hypothetical protein